MKTGSTVVLKKGRARPLWSGHPWVFAGAVDRMEGEHVPGQLVRVVDAEGQVIGWGHLGSGQPITVRMLSLGSSSPDEHELLGARLAQAVRRRAIIGLPSEETTAYRLVFSEGDCLSGLVIDRLGDGVAIQLGSAGMLRLEPIILELVRKLLDPAWATVSVPDEAARMESLAPQERLVVGDAGAVAETCVREHGVSFGVDPLGGQKTGFYADQRDNRLRAASLARGRCVLDAFSYGGGFGLTCLIRGAARRVVSVDTSPRACRLARKNAEKNDGNLEVVEADAITYLRESALDEAFDMVILDPPKFARGRQGLEESLKKYRKLNELAMRVLPEGGLLVTSSCSGHVSVSDFVRMLGDAAFQAGRTLHVLEVRGQAPCHPTLAAAQEGAYLKCVIAQVQDR